MVVYYVGHFTPRKDVPLLGDLGKIPVIPDNIKQSCSDNSGYFER